MKRMFGERIQEFVLSIDIMDLETFHDLLDLIQKYVKLHLNVLYFSVLEEDIVDNRQGLSTIWTTRESSPAFTVNGDRSFASHTAFTFGNDKPIWVVSESKEPLQGAEDLIDMWSGAAELPPYNVRNDEEVKTSVMHPLRRDGRPFGVIEFAAAKYVEPTPASLEETRTLAGVVSRAYQMYHASRAQRKSTRQAMRMLNDALDSQNWGRLAMPQVFVAYSGTKRLEDQASEAHTKLIESIRKVIGRFSNVLKPVYWEDITEAGNINAQVIREIGDSEFGICYFSEPAEGGGFIDNSNVLFKAGMMQALTNAGGILRGWIPIREMESPQLPFDVAEERFLIVERGEDGALNVDEFSKTLHSRIEALVKLLDNGK